MSPIGAKDDRSATARDVDVLDTIAAVLGGRIDRRLRGGTLTRRNRRPWLIGGAAVAVLLVAGLLTWTLWPDSRPDPRARVYLDTTACLLTPAAGVTDKEAAPVWAGMQQASLATRGKVQYLEVDGPQTSAQASTYLATLAGSKCDLIVTVGRAQNDALSHAASSYPKTRFVLVGNGAPQPNVTVVDGSDPTQVTDEVRAQVSKILTG
jgi:hypothetical protein